MLRSRHIIQTVIMSSPVSLLVVITSQRNQEFLTATLSPTWRKECQQTSQLSLNRKHGLSKTDTTNTVY